MGWRNMGETRGPSLQGDQENHKASRCKPNSGSFNLNRANLESGVATRFKRKHPLPSVGDRFGELTVVGYEYGSAGGVTFIHVQCSCGAEAHKVYAYNLFKGRSTRCNVCAKKQTAHWQKQYSRYKGIVDDPAHRRRLINRISSCVQRCHNPKSATYVNYGARGIHVFDEWRHDRGAFLAYLTTLDGWDNPELELDRTNVDKGYQPGNLRFISRHENMLNKRKVQVLQSRVLELEACLRRCTCGAAKCLHDSH